MLTPHRNHSHYWVQEEQLFESYNTLRGLRYLLVCNVTGIQDCERCSDDMIKYIESEFL